MEPIEPSDNRSVPVVISGTDVTGKKCRQSVIAHDLSTQGARLDGVSHALATGTNVKVIYNGMTVAATVVWLAVSTRTGTNQAGIRLLDPKRCPWRKALPDIEGAIRMPERRKADRYTASLEIEMRCLPEGVPTQTNTADVGIGGCYVEASMPLPTDTRLEVVLHLGAKPIRTGAIVRATYPGVGMGIEFLDLPWEDQEQLYKFLESRSCEAVEEC